MYQPDPTHPTPELTCPLIFHVITGLCGAADSRIQNQDDQREQLETRMQFWRLLDEENNKRHNRLSRDTLSRIFDQQVWFFNYLFLLEKENAQSAQIWISYLQLSVGTTLDGYHTSIVEECSGGSWAGRNKTDHGDLDTPFSAWLVHHSSSPRWLDSVDFM